MCKRPKTLLAFILKQKSKVQKAPVTNPSEPTVKLQYLCTAWYIDDDTKQTHFKRCIATVSLLPCAGWGGEGAVRNKETNIESLGDDGRAAFLSVRLRTFFSHFVVDIFLPLTNCPMLGATSGNF